MGRYVLVSAPNTEIETKPDELPPRIGIRVVDENGAQVGDLHVLDVVKGEIVNKARVTEPYSKDGHWRDPRRRLAIADDQIAVTDPRHSLVRVVDGKRFKRRAPSPWKVRPFNRCRRRFRRVALRRRDLCPKLLQFRADLQTASPEMSMVQCGACKFMPARTSAVVDLAVPDHSRNDGFAVFHR